MPTTELAWALGVSFAIQVCDKGGTPVGQQLLTFGGKLPQDSSTLDECKTHSGGALHLTRAPPGGGCTQSAEKKEDRDEVAFHEAGGEPGVAAAAAAKGPTGAVSNAVVHASRCACGPLRGEQSRCASVLLGWAMLPAPLRILYPGQHARDTHTPRQHRAHTASTSTTTLLRVRP